jgi:hypothetical protein
MLQLIPPSAPCPDAVVANEVEATTSPSSFSSSLIVVIVTYFHPSVVAAISFALPFNSVAKSQTCGITTTTPRPRLPQRARSPRELPPSSHLRNRHRRRRLCVHYRSPSPPSRSTPSGRRQARSAAAGEGEGRPPPSLSHQSRRRCRRGRGARRGPPPRTRRTPPGPTRGHQGLEDTVTVRP